MITYYEVAINKMARSVNNKEENYHSFDNETLTFATLQEVKDYIKENYSGHKKEKMYVDKKDGSTQHIGYIYSFKNADLSHSPVERWYQQNWITITEVKKTRIIIK